ncbi:hypothetical protein GCM10011492_39490 [Flexivirga endophytica]|uniref:DUF2505 domain-containing protein n=1 Tax=Flexivirga endophytica TaxID=1849103 RepID=A0A916THL3_9MICO|nr:DUF2505 domain-containing protein [Flexivirga endophytica]GGB44505.1 hypothetical protein GCM10011492_39490 [Flexivirga endophytica]GHB60395.1 hypothetical protein GCM10008112_31690 [Flexivirga endophytica]
MKISKQWTLPATPDEVYALSIDPAYQEEICEEAGALSHQSTVTEKGSGHEVKVQRVMTSGDVPDLVKKIVGDKVDVTQVITWGARQADGSRQGTLDVAFKGKPITMKGTTSLTPDGDGTAVDVTAEFKAKVPVVGGKVEKMSAPEIIKAIGAEETVGMRHAAG